MVWIDLKRLSPFTLPIESWPSSTWPGGYRMGLCVSQTAQIDSLLENDKKASTSVIKILLLGAGECGKSTVLKQMKILHKNGFTKEEKATAVRVVYCNTMHSIQTLVHGCNNMGIPLSADLRVCTQWLWHRRCIEHSSRFSSHPNILCRLICRHARIVYLRCSIPPQCHQVRGI